VLQHPQHFFHACLASLHLRQRHFLQRTATLLSLGLFDLGIGAAGLDHAANLIVDGHHFVNPEPAVKR
jgi:hypothetical protein